MKTKIKLLFQKIMPPWGVALVIFIMAKEHFYKYRSLASLRYFLDILIYNLGIKVSATERTFFKNLIHSFDSSIDVVCMKKEDLEY